MKTGTNYRMLEPWEPVEKGDEYCWAGEWDTATNWQNKPPRQMQGTQYRRPMPATPAFVPQWKHPDDPSVPVHVLWAESPSTVRTVAQVAAEAKPEPVKPGTGYRLVPQGELIQTGDEWLQADGTWRATQLPGNIYKHIDSSSTLRRKLPVPEPQYRPYANAAEAAAGLQGKLICHINETGNYYHPLSVDDAGIKVGSGHRYTMIGLKEYWKFTDGTPCGVPITDQGTK